MAEAHDYQKTISQYRSRISFASLIFVGFLIALILWAKPLFFNQPERVISSGLELKNLEFALLVKGLETKTEPVSLEQVVEVDRGVGKLEPFQ